MTDFRKEIHMILEKVKISDMYYFITSRAVSDSKCGKPNVI